MFSTFADNSIGPIVACVCVIIIFTILTQMEIPFYDSISPYLFTTHMLGWKGFFYVRGVEGVTVDGSIENLPAIMRSGIVLIVYSIVFLGVACWHFNRKNILS
jgi:ABC-2 type transport system permease protein